jgi:putative flippase GtrA
MFAIAFAFYMQSTYVWETGYKDAYAAAKFALLNTFAFALNIALLNGLTAQKLPAIAAQAVSLVCIAAISYVAQKKWIFHA